MDKFYIIGIRHNPQLGSYLSEAIVAKPRIGKQFISVPYESYGSKSNLRFTLQPNFIGQHFCRSRSKCVYGDYEYIGYSSKDAAVGALKVWLGKPGLSATRASAAIEKFEAA